MFWMIQRHGFRWPSMKRNYIEMAKGCRKCQKIGPITRALAMELNPVTQRWPFKSWALDIIGEMRPHSSKGDAYILVATDYFTKWVEAKAYQ
ncbi:hypothetical protein MLD38_025612 [Melastoma candidum]|uniref:Uncharacterized protein n=1 Tax=Melastoma candidum TaxID=119954 RepID=A0ACB9NVX4_9MYRT|nr:hypothetical protein MLD38_025612 [Melastoma candidum]